MGGNGSLRPKPLAMVGEMPILWHVMSIYAEQGYSAFILCLGERGDQIEASVKAFPEIQSDQWQATYVETGDDTPTGGRVNSVAPYVNGGTFFLTYADGLADIDIEGLLRFHNDHDRSASVTLVRPRSPWGVVKLDKSSQVERFDEKPVLDHWINGGFFCMEPDALESIHDGDVLERESMTRLIDADELCGYRHTGYWECMDTYKDALHLNDFVERGEIPWRVKVTV